MKKFLIIILLALLMPDAFSQTVTDELDRIIHSLSEILHDATSQITTEEINIRNFENKKKRGYFNTTQIGFMMGNRQIIDQFWGWNPITLTEIKISPTVTMTHGYMFNEHLAAGVGVGFEVFNHRFFPVFADVRFTLWDNKVSPFFAIKAGYSFGNFKEKHYEALHIDFGPINIHDAYFRNYGGFMLNPEMGIKIPLSGKADLLFSVAYRYQKTKMRVTPKRDLTPFFNEWEQNASLNRLAIGLAIMFR